MNELTLSLSPPIKKINTDASQFTIQKHPSETKEIEGIICEKWEVINTKKDITLTYWVAHGFSFFHKFLTTVNREGPTELYFLQINNSAGYFPLLTIERKGSEEIVRLKVNNIQRKKLPNNQLLQKKPVNASHQRDKRTQRPSPSRKPFTSYKQARTSIGLESSMPFPGRPW